MVRRENTGTHKAHPRPSAPPHLAVHRRQEEPQLLTAQPPGPREQAEARPTGRKASYPRLNVFEYFLTRREYFK